MKDFSSESAKLGTLSRVVLIRVGETNYFSIDNRDNWSVRFLKPTLKTESQTHA